MESDKIHPTPALTPHDRHRPHWPTWMRTAYTAGSWLGRHHRLADEGQWDEAQIAAYRARFCHALACDGYRVHLCAPS